MANITSPILDNPTAKRLLHLPWKLSYSAIGLSLIILLAVVLRFANLSAIGDGNLYYTAAIKSMLQSPSNFFFAAAEPGGSVTVDKPPVGLWLQAISAMIFGVNGFAVVLPQILAGVFSIPLLYHLVKRYWGSTAGLIAALVLAVTPVSIATERNNTMDATLICTLLLAAWAFIKATDTGKLKWLLVGGVLIGIGFNIKMLQAFLPLPAFYALYLFTAKVGWKRKFVALTLTSIVMVAVSLSWAVAVDLTPANQRPYIGSSTNNTVMELIVGHNGLSRLIGEGTPGGGMPGNGIGTDDGQGSNFAPPNNGQMQPPNAQDGNFPPPDGRGGGMGASEIGTPGVLRLFTAPLANEISWLLPLGLFMTGLMLFASRIKFPLSAEHQAVVLWGGWLVTEVVFFSIAGFYHAYYLAMLAPPLAALIGIGVIKLWRLRETHGLLAVVLLALAAIGTVVFQAWVVSQYMNTFWWGIPGIVLVVGGIILLPWKRATRLAFACLVVGMLLVPTVWSGLTTFMDNQNAALPHAYNGETATDRGFPGMGRETATSTDLLSYLEANTQDTRYLVAVGSANEGDYYVLQTGRPVLYMGGFLGTDPVVDAADMQQMVDNGELRYILWGDRGRGSNSNSDIATWLQSSCSAVTDVATQGRTLYQCGS